MRALPFCLVAFVFTGCATRVAGGLDVLAEARGPVSGQVVRQSVDLRHTEHGWVTVELDGSNRVAWRLQGDAGSAPTVAALPQGRYDSVRIKSLTAVPTDDARASEVTWVATEALVREDFCIGSKDPSSRCRWSATPAASGRPRSCRSTRPASRGAARSQTAPRPPAARRGPSVVAIGLIGTGQRAS